MSLGESENVRNAIANEDSKYIQKAAGVGKKSAERVIVDLKDKVGLAISVNYAGETGATGALEADEALEALMALGYNLNDATKALESVPGELSTAERVTAALKNNF